MNAWLFVSLEKGRAHDARLHSSVGEAELKSHATRFSKARLRKKRLQVLKRSIERFPITPNEDVGGKLSSRGVLWHQPEQLVSTTPTLSHPQNTPGLCGRHAFAPGHMSNLAPAMQQALEYAYEVLWPMNSPAIQGPSLKKTIEFWRASAVQCPLTFYSQVSNAATLCLAKATDAAYVRQMSMLRTIYQGRAINLIQKAVGELAGPPSTSLISCIMNIHGQGGQILEPAYCPLVPESPIFAAFNLKLYGRFAYPSQHFPALTELLRQRGGINTLPPGAANPLQLADLAGANLTFTTPKFPLLASISEMADQNAAQYDDYALGLLGTLGTGFSARMESDDCGMFRILSEACQLTASIDQYHREVALRLPLHVLAAKAIEFQHHLLSLPPCPMVLNDTLTRRAEAVVYQAIRLTTLIYSDFMIFPSAEVRQGRQRLAAYLRDCLLRWFDMQDEMLSTQAVFQDLLLWFLVLGGVASSNTTLRGWYVRQLFEQLLIRSITWDMLETTLYSFLYWDYVFTTPVTNLWVEARSLGTHGGLEGVHWTLDMDVCEFPTLDIGNVPSKRLVGGLCDPLPVCSEED